jgi:hypothetical protein
MSLKATVLARAKREGWTQQIEAAKHAAGLTQSNAITPLQSIAAVMQERGERYRQCIAGVAKQLMAELGPWIEREKAEHIRRIVAIAKRGFQRIEKMWEENEIPEAKAESLVAATLDKHDAIIRRNLDMNETQVGSGSLNLDVLVGGGRVIVAAPQQQE